MHILLITAEYPPAVGGIGDYTALLAMHLAALGETVTVATAGTGGQCRDGAVTVLPVVRWWDWGMVAAMRGIVRQVRPDVVHLQYQAGMYGMHPAVNLLPRLLRRWPQPRRSGDARGTGDCRVVTTFHDLRTPYLFPKAGPVRGLAVRELARGSDAVIATNGADAAALRAWGLRAALVPIGSNIPAVDRADASAVRARYRIPAGSVLLTTFGLLNHSKGLPTLLDTLAALRAEGLDAHLLIVGAGTGMSDGTNTRTAANVASHAEAAGIAPYITATGPLPAHAVAETLAASDVCLLPYRDGASPRRGSLLAALAQGVPVVTTAPAPGIYDGLPVLRDRDAALLVPSDDAAALAAAARAIIAGPDLAARLRAGAAAYARLFAWPGIAQQMVAVYESLAVAAIADAARGAVTAGNR